MSPIIEAMKPSPNSDRQSCASLGELFPKNGTASATESPTTFVSSRPTIFGSSRRPGIASIINYAIRTHGRFMRVRWPMRLFRLLPAAFDRLRDLLVLLGHLCEAVFSQTLRPRSVPFRRLLARFLRLVLGRHRLPFREGGAGARRAGRKVLGIG